MNYLNSVVRILGAVLVVFTFYLTAFAIEVKSNKIFRNYEKDKRVHQIFDKLVTETGRAGEVPPLYIVEQPVMNAYASVNSVVLYRGLEDFTINDDEIALILGHEISHVTSWDVEMQGGYKTDVFGQAVEARADKMGAYYMMRAGFDICKAREIWKRWKDTDGDYLGGDHPGMAYRYDQLNIQCEPQYNPL